MQPRYLILTLFLLLLFCTAEGQEISVMAEYPRVVQTGEQFMISWTINSGDGDFREPPFTGFYKLMGPQTSYSSSTQIINGKVSRETKYTYTYYLQAMKEGKQVIPPASVTVKNKTYSSDSIRIEVVGSGSSRQEAAVPGDDAAEAELDDTGEDVFVNLTVDKRNVFVGEPVGVTVKLYTRVEISGINEIKYPGFEGFLRTDLDTPPLTSLKRESINGTIYGTGVVQHFLLYPQFPGEVTIDPVQLSVLIRRKSGQSDLFFGDFFATYTTVPKAILSKSVRIKVNPLPGNRPADFSGIVGRIAINASLDRDSVNMNDAINLKISLSGSGNLKIANPPSFNLPADIEVYDPKITDNLKNSLSGTTGQKTFEYLLIPRHHGDFVIPPVTYSYFNADARRYETITTPELKFHVFKTGDPASGITVYGGVAKEDVKYLGKDIRFISSKPGFLRKTDRLSASRKWFWTAYAFSLLLFFIILFIRREHIRRTSDLSAVRIRKAGKVAGLRLMVAAQCLKEKKSDRFYEEILKALWGYLSDKLSIPVSELTRTRAVEALRMKGIPDKDVESLAAVIDLCEFARYAPSSSREEDEKVYEEAARFIRLLENTLG
jgi:hypothetical protein